MTTRESIPVNTGGENTEESAPVSARGIHVGRWHSFRIPAGALRFTLGTSGQHTDPVVPELLLELWPHWFEIAIGHMQLARDAHVRLIDANTSGDGKTRGDALDDELQSSMQTICAVAFAIDGLYGALADHVPVEPALKATWRAHRTSRASIVLEVIRRASVLKNSQVISMKRVLKSLFTFRGWAVHPPADFREAILHPDIAVGVDQRYVQFRSANADMAMSGGLEVALRILSQPRDLPGHKDWCTPRRQIVDEILAAAGITWSWNGEAAP